MPTLKNEIAGLLDDLARSPEWSPRWMTVAEIAAELERLDFWEQPALRRYAGEARLDFLAGLLAHACAEEGPAWAQMGARFKHSALLTEKDHALLAGWLDDRRAALNEDLSRILLGEPPSWRSDGSARGPDLGDCLRQARPLVAELAQLARRLAWSSDYEEAPGAAREALPQARRIREIATTLTGIFDVPAGCVAGEG